MASRNSGCAGKSSVVNGKSEGHARVCVSLCLVSLSALICLPEMGAEELFQALQAFNKAQAQPDNYIFSFITF